MPKVKVNDIEMYYEVHGEENQLYSYMDLRSLAKGGHHSSQTSKNISS